MSDPLNNLRLRVAELELRVNGGPPWGAIIFMVGFVAVVTWALCSVGERLVRLEKLAGVRPAAEEK